MNIVEMQHATLPLSAFPISDIRPISYSTNIASRQSSKENRTPNLSPKIHVSETIYETKNLDKSAEICITSSPQFAGKKRLANGQVKKMPPDALKLNNTHTRDRGTISNTDTSSIKEVSQQLRTKLTYAMVKIQHGWTDRSLEEVESLASASPRSTTFSHMSDIRSALSPRASLTAQLRRQHSDSSSDPGHHSERQDINTITSPSLRNGLAPPVHIVSRQSRDPTLNGAGPPHRPTVTQRTASQNAVLEADAVETLMFMASPNNSGYQSSQFSPVTSASSTAQFPSQTSPVRNISGLSKSHKRVSWDTRHQWRNRESIIASVVERLDEDGGAELDEVLRTLDNHYATKPAE